MPTRPSFPKSDPSPPLFVSLSGAPPFYPHTLGVRHAALLLLPPRRHAPQLSLMVEGNLHAAGARRYSESAGILYVVRETRSTIAASESCSGSASFSADAVYGPDGGGIPGGGSSAGGVEVDGQPSRLVTVRNLRPGRRVVIAVVNVTMYFSVTPVANPSSECGGGGLGDSGDAIAAACTHAGKPGGGRCNVGFRGWGQGLGTGAVADGIELFDVPAGESLTLSVTPRLDKLRSGKGLALLANEQSLEVSNSKEPIDIFVLHVFFRFLWGRWKKRTRGTFRTTHGRRRSYGEVGALATGR